MRKTIFYGAMAFCYGLLLAPSVHAQNAGAAAGSIAGSESSSGAVSGAGAAAILNQNIAAPSADTRSHQDLEYSGTYTLKNTPNAIAPNIYPSANCHGSSSAGGGVPGFGISIGTSWQDDDCQYRETSRNFFQMGMKADAVAVLCASPFAANAPACKALQPKPTPQPTAAYDERRRAAARDADDTRRRSTNYTAAPTDDTGPADVILPDDVYNSGIIAASNGELWKKQDGRWQRVASNGTNR